MLFFVAKTAKQTTKYVNLTSYERISTIAEVEVGNYCTGLYPGVATALSPINTSASKHCNVAP